MSDLELECRLTPDAAAYVLGALGDDEAEAFRAHVVTCAACQREVAELQPVVDMLPATAPEVPAPDLLRDRIMAVVNSEAQLLHAAGDDADRVPAPARRRWRLRPVGVLAAAGAVAAGVVVGAVANGGGGSTRVDRAIVASGTGASAVLRQSSGHAELDVSHLTQAPGGRVYQVWVQKGQRPPSPTDALFVVDRAGNAVVAVPGNLHGARQVMVTSEPVGGSLAPTSRPVISIPLAS